MLIRLRACWFVPHSAISRSLCMIVQVCSFILCSSFVCFSNDYLDSIRRLLSFFFHVCCLRTNWSLKIFSFSRNACKRFTTRFHFSQIIDNTVRWKYCSTSKTHYSHYTRIFGMGVCDISWGYFLVVEKIIQWREY